MSNEMIERVAAAIARVIARVDEDSIDPYGAAARAAIKAMREPTKKMITAAMITPYPTVEECGGLMEQAEEVVKLEWQSMIDEALR